MKTRILILMAALLLPLTLFAQASDPPDPPPPPARAGGGPPMRGPRGFGPGGPGHMGEWWKNSELAKKLQLTDAQVKQLNETFLDHRLKLIDYRAEMEKQDLKLKSLLDEDVPNAGQVNAQVDQVLAARGKLEREFTMMG